MNYKIVLALVLVVVASGCISQGDTQTSPDTSNPDTTRPADNPDSGDSDNTITFTGNGFQPSTLTIQVGETVTWVNEGSSSMWIASDQHPVHSEYSGSSIREHCSNGDQTSAAFDQCSTGDEFSFTFEKTGEWGYHNHQPYVAGGTIIVESN